MQDSQRNQRAMRSLVRCPVKQSKQLVAGEFFRGERWPGGGRAGWKVRRCVHGHVNQDPGIGMRMTGLGLARTVKLHPGVGQGIPWCL
jgi:hypothetical protein